MVCNRRRNSSSLSCLRSDSRVIALRYFISSFCSSPWLAIIHGIVQYCFASFPSAGGLLSFATSSLLILAFCWFFLLQCKTLDQPPLSFVFFFLKIPQRKDGTLLLQTEGAFLCKSMAAMLRDTTVVAAVVRCAYAPTNNTASQDNHEKINSWVTFNFHIWDAYGAPLGGPSGRRSSANIVIIYY